MVSSVVWFSGIVLSLVHRQDHVKKSPFASFGFIFVCIQCRVGLELCFEKPRY